MKVRLTGLKFQVQLNIGKVMAEYGMIAYCGLALIGIMTLFHLHTFRLL